MQNRIFSMDNAKAEKARGFGYVDAIHYLAPATQGGVGDVCPWRTAPCTALCLGWEAGHAAIGETNNVRESRIAKTRRFMRDRAAYMRDVVRSIEQAQRAADRLGAKLCVRMNGSSDIAWEHIPCERNGEKFRSLMAAFPDTQFIDYTKNPKRFDRALPANYHITFSRSESNEADAIMLLKRGVNVAVVFKDKPATWNGFRVIDGDEHDLRHLDPRGGVVVGLVPKGRKAKADTSGFVVH